MKSNFSSIENQYRSFVKNFIGIAFQRTMDFIPVFFHGQVEKITGYKERDFLQGAPRWDQIIYPEDLPKIYRDARLLKKIPNTTIDREYRIIKKGDEVSWIREIIQNVCNQEGKISLVQGTIYDITRRKKQEQEQERLLVQLEQEKQKAEQLALEAARHASELEAIFTALVDILVVFNNKGMAVSANPAVMQYLGFNPVGKSYNQLLKTTNIRHLDGQPLLKKDFFSLIKQVREKKTLPAQNFLLTGYRGEEVATLLSASPIFKDNKLAGIVVIGHDVSARLKLEKQKDAFIAIASHELKTPLTTLQAFAQIMYKYVQNNQHQECKYYLNRMNSQLNRLSGLVEELLDVSRIETGKLELHKETFDFNNLLKEVAEDMERVSGTHKIIIIGQATRHLWADRNRLGQTLINLLSNAIKYSPKAKKVVVEVTTNNNRELVVSVKDFGIGINLKDQEKIFERFFQINHSSGHQFPGLGLGLYISSEIIKRHSGKMRVKSQPGKGSTFYFTIPLEEKDV